MCLLITGPSQSIRSTLLHTPRLLEDIYVSNADGIGAMYPSASGLQTPKALPRTVQQARQFIQALPKDSRNLALHWRMRTHGAINKANCHPYTVVPGQLEMMHNGVLHTGNKADPGMSDTWHFIQDYLAPLAQHGAGLIHEPALVALIAEFIGDNRFAFMTEDGRLTVINRDDGMEHQDLWFSNTYAWSPELLIPSYDDGCGDWFERAFERPSRKARTPSTSRYAGGQLIAAIRDADVHRTRRILEHSPDDAIEDLFGCHYAEPFEVSGTFSRLDQRLITDLTQQDLTAVQRAAKTGPHHLAEVMCHYLNWVAHEPDAWEFDDEEIPAGPMVEESHHVRLSDIPLLA